MLNKPIKPPIDTFGHSGKAVVGRGPLGRTMIEQRYIVCLGERDGKQIWLAYDSMGRIGNAKYDQAWRYATINAAFHALAKVRRERRWPDAKIMGTTVDMSHE